MSFRRAFNRSGDSRPVAVEFVEMKKKPSRDDGYATATRPIAVADDSDSLSSYLGSFCYKKIRTYHARERDCYTSSHVANVARAALLVGVPPGTLLPGSHSSSMKKSR